MATVINKRDVDLQAASPRTASVNLGSTVNVDGNVTGTLDGTAVSTVVTAALSATANYFTTSTSDPSGGANGDAHYNSSTNVMWFKISGTWTQGGTINANAITVGTLAAARIASGSIDATKLSVSSLSAITANLGSVTAGTISSGTNITITGQGSFNGATNSGGVNYAGVFNSTLGNPGGVSAFAGTAGIAVRGDAGSSSSAIGVSGTSTGNGDAVRATNSVGLALNVVGRMAITNTTVVSNLNADMIDGYHAASFCSIVPANTGTCTVSGQGFNLQVTGALAGTVRTRGTSNFVYIENVSDERLKKDITDEVLGLDFIKLLNAKNYRMKEGYQGLCKGFMAQDIAVIPGGDQLVEIHEDGTMGVNYTGILSVMVNAIKELSAEVDKLKKSK